MKARLVAMKVEHSFVVAVLGTYQYLREMSGGEFHLPCGRQCGPVHKEELELGVQQATRE